MMLKRVILTALLLGSLAGCASTTKKGDIPPNTGVYATVINSSPIKVPANETLVVCDPILKGQNTIMYYLSNSFPCDTSLVVPVKAVCITDVYGVFQIINEFEQQNYKCNKFKGTQK